MILKDGFIGNRKIKYAFVSADFIKQNAEIKTTGKQFFIMGDVLNKTEDEPIQQIFPIYPETFLILENKNYYCLLADDELCKELVK